jgi:hypothetical protein
MLNPYEKCSKDKDFWATKHVASGKEKYRYDMNIKGMLRAAVKDETRN